MPVDFTILGSGSTGNCSYLETESTRILIDAGFSGRQIRQRLLSIQRAPEGIQGILVTHEHSDHISGLAVIAGKLGIPVYCNRLTRDAIASIVKTPLPYRVFETGSRFEIGDVEIESFSVPHDAQDPVGFMIRTRDGNIGFLTDLGHATKLVMERVKPANLLVLEANHDIKLLQEDTKRPWSVKQRIVSRHGHLCNAAAASAAADLASAHLQQVFLGHLSRDCNRPELAMNAVQNRLQEIGALHIRLTLTQQDSPAATVRLGPQTPAGGQHLSSSPAQPETAAQPSLQPSYSPGAASPLQTCSLGEPWPT